MAAIDELNLFVVGLRGDKDIYFVCARKKGREETEWEKLICDERMRRGHFGGAAHTQHILNVCN